MEPNEKAKMLLLGNNCNNCKFLKKELKNPNEVYEIDLKKYIPLKLVLESICFFDFENQNVVVSDPESHVCENYKHTLDIWM